MNYLKDMHEMCDTLSRELGEANDKINSAGGKLSGSDLDYVDKLTHAIKSIKTTIAMIEAEEDGYSNGYPHMYNSYADGYGGSYRSYGGRKRDSMGRYSSRGYSRDSEMVAELHRLMESAPDERTRQEFQRFITKVEGMS